MLHSFLEIQSWKHPALLHLAGDIKAWPQRSRKVLCSSLWAVPGRSDTAQRRVQYVRISTEAQHISWVKVSVLSAAWWGYGLKPNPSQEKLITTATGGVRGGDSHGVSRSSAFISSCEVCLFFFFSPSGAVIEPHQEKGGRGGREKRKTYPVPVTSQGPRNWCSCSSA